MGYRKEPKAEKPIVANYSRLVRRLEIKQCWSSGGGRMVVLEIPVCHGARLTRCSIYRIISRRDIVIRFEQSTFSSQQDENVGRILFVDIVPDLTYL